MKAKPQIENLLFLERNGPDWKRRNIKTRASLTSYPLRKKLARRVKARHIKAIAKALKQQNILGAVWESAPSIIKGLKESLKKLRSKIGWETRLSREKAVQAENETPSTKISTSPPASEIEAPGADPSSTTCVGKADQSLLNLNPASPTKMYDDSFSQTFPLDDECKHYSRRKDVEWDIQKYYDQRHTIFSLYDEGIYMTDDAWFGVTPEPVANQVATELSCISSPSKTVLIDMFAGAGGNVIAFALSNRWSKIIAIEKNPSVIACAQNNAHIYDVYDLITWVNDDSFSYLAANTLSINPDETVIFASPPWGGPGYTSDKIFNLSTMAPYSIKEIHDACRGMESALYLPRTSDLRQIAKLAPGGKKVEVVQYCVQGASKALVAYIPAAEDESTSDS